MTEKTKKILKLIGAGALAFTSGMLFGSLCAGCSNAVSSKAETPINYIYELKDHSSPWNFTWNGYNYKSIVYVNNTRYDGVYGVQFADSLGSLYINQQNNYIELEATQNVAIVPIDLEDTDDLPGQAYPQYFNRYEYLDYNFEFISMPHLIDTFSNQTYKGIPITTIGYAPTNYTIYNGLFYSNGKEYHTITIRLAQLDGTEWYVDKNEIAFNSSANSTYRNLCYIANMKYDNDTVYQIDGTMYQGDYYLTTSYRWNNSNYQKIHFLANDTTSTYPNYPGSTFRQVFDSYNLGRVIAVDDSLSSAFNLIALTLVSIMPVLNFKIASDITLGALVLVPLTIGIIIAIIKLIKR